MAPFSSSAYVNRGVSSANVQNPSVVEWDDGVTVSSGVGNNNGVVDICFKVNATPEIQNLLLS